MQATSRFVRGSALISLLALAAPFTGAVAPTANAQSTEATDIVTLRPVSNVCPNGARPYRVDFTNSYDPPDVARPVDVGIMFTRRPDGEGNLLPLAADGVADGATVELAYLHGYLNLLPGTYEVEASYEDERGYVNLPDVVVPDCGDFLATMPYPNKVSRSDLVQGSVSVVKRKKVAGYGRKRLMLDIVNRFYRRSVYLSIVEKRPGTARVVYDQTDDIGLEGNANVAVLWARPNFHTQSWLERWNGRRWLPFEVGPRGTRYVLRATVRGQQVVLDRLLVK